MISTRTLAFTAATAAALAAAFTAVFLISPSFRGETRPSADPACFNRSSEQIGGPFKLTANNGATVTQEDFKGRKTLVFFGFTHCPDVCPDTLFRTGTAMTMLPKGVKPPRTVLISVDPARDTPETLSQYIKSNGFPADIVGLTGTLEELQQVADAFAAPFSRDEEAESTSGYIVNHSAILYLMDENWKLESFFQPGARPAEIASCIAALS
jgi:protein SCO1/2